MKLFFVHHFPDFFRLFAMNLSFSQKQFCEMILFRHIDHYEVHFFVEFPHFFQENGETVELFGDIVL